MCSSKSATESGKKKPDIPCDESKGAKCATPAQTTPIKYKLVTITVIANATQTNVTGAKNWATVKKATDEIIIQATTSPNDVTGWGQINWSGDSGNSVPGHLNQRSFSRSSSKKLHIKAELGGVEDNLDVWVIWATVKINTSGTTPANAVQTGARYDGTENLGSRSYNSGNSAVGKVIPEAQITPAGINEIVKSGWDFKRERMSHDWNDGLKVRPGSGSTDYWNTVWIDDTSYASAQVLVPTNDGVSGSKDQIYDRDAPNILEIGTMDYETYNNFRQWIEWNHESCSEKKEWYWKGVWQKSKTPQVTLKEVGTGNIVLPIESPLHPPSH